MKYKKYPRYKDSGVEWLGEIPEHWEISKFKYEVYFQEGPGILGKDFHNEGIPLIRISNLSSEIVSDVFKQYLDPAMVKEKWNHFRVQENDLLISASATTGIISTVDSTTVGSVPYTGIIRLKPNNKNTIRAYIKWFVLSNSFLTQIDQLKTGTAMQHFGPYHLNMIGIIKVLPNEQQQIANFLDNAIAKIDTLIEKQTKLIEILKEKRQAVISHAVTKGINSDVKMKDSGVEWLGEIPEHWNVSGFKRYLESIVDYRGKTPEKVDDGIFLVTARNIKNGKINYNASSEYVKESNYKDIMSRGIPSIGDVLFTTEAPLGEVSNVDRTHIALAQRVIKFRGKKLILDNYYLKYFMMSYSFQSSLKLFASGSTALGIKAERFVYLRKLLPPFLEQQQIANYLDDKTSKIDKLIEKANKSIELLKEKRTALISAAVTGKIDVREEV